MAYITVRSSVRHRSVALVTRDPELYHELAGFLRERHVPTISLLPGDRIPDQVAVVLTSNSEAPLISHSNVLPVTEAADRRSLAAAVRHALESADPTETIVVGLDPGPRPGTPSSPGQPSWRRGYSNPPSRPERSRASCGTGSRPARSSSGSVGETRPHGTGS